MRTLILLALCIGLAYQHAIFWDPPARQSMGQARPSCHLPINVDHMSVWCGGAGPMHNSVNQGKCGICGDEFTVSNKEYEAGGKYANGVIAKSYMPGQLIDVKVKLIANHKGFFTFALCAHNNPNTSPARSCFINNPLTVNGGGRYYATIGTGYKEMKVQLPAGLTCKQCILQITYTAGNNWGTGAQSAEVQTMDCIQSQTGKLGCGPQETFRGCSDICIGSFCPQEQCAKAGDIAGGTGPWLQPVIPVTQPPVTPPPQTNMCVSAGIKAQYYNAGGDQYCKSICLGKTRDQCYQGANAKFLCYCSQVAGGRGRQGTALAPYPAVILDRIIYPYPAVVLDFVTYPEFP